MRLLASPRGTKSPGRATARVAITLTLVASLAAPARGMEIEGVRFPAEIHVRGVSLALNNAALLRYRIFIKAYVAALYLAEATRPEEVLTDVAKRLEIEYFWAISAPDFAMATDKGIAANVDAATSERLRPRITQMNALYRDVKPGDRYALTYVPGAGTELSLNGRPLGTIEGSDFAAALFSIWLGKNALDVSLRDRLLARR